MYTTATRPASVSTSRRTPTFDAYSRYKALALGRANHSQPKLTSVKTALPAEIGSTAYTYSYTAQNSACTGKPGIPAGTDLSNAGKSSNRTSQTITNPSVNGGSAVSTYHCYDQADRLVYSSDPTVGVPEYDSHGNTTKLGAGSSTQLELTYDSSDRNSQILQINPSTAAGTAIQYNRDVQGRLTKRRSFTITNWNWSEQTTAQSNYGYTASGDTPDFVKDSSGTIVEKYLTLPGDVLLTIRPTEPDTAKQKTYSLPNIHGDIMATTNTSGIVLGTFTAGPFGESLNITGTNQTQPVIASLANQPASKDPNNTRPGTSFDYVGQHEKLTESSLTLQPTQMGARVYIASLGRFLSVDPIQDGSYNNYTYAVDPVNEFDLTGNALLWKKIANIASVASMIPGPIGMAASAVAAASYAAAGDKKAAAMAIACVAAAAVPGAVAAIKVAKAAKEVKNLRTATALGMMRNVDRAIIANNAAQLSRNANRGTVLLRSQNGGIGVHLTGKAHAGMPTPHTHIYRANIAPSGRVSMNKTKQFRLTSYNDLRLVRKYLRKGR